MAKKPKNKTIEEINCPRCGHSKAWSSPTRYYKKCTKCGHQFTQQETKKGFFSSFRGGE